MKKVIGQYRTQQKHWVGDGFHVSTLFSYDRLGQLLSPFLMLDYAAPEFFSPTTTPRGVGAHPHRGFETVTIAYKGEISHRDSHGGGGTIQTGDVQWMTAGAGLLHEELHSKAFAQQGGELEMVQLWVNLPTKDKMTHGKYQAITQSEIPSIVLDDAGSYLRVIAGQYTDVQGAASTFSPVNVWDIQLMAEQQHEFNVPAGQTCIVVVRQGTVSINQQYQVADHSFVLFERDDATPIQISAEHGAGILILTGQPLNEPIQGYGPFVMNTQQEIMQAIHDFNRGDFGEM